MTSAKLKYERIAVGDSAAQELTLSPEIVARFGRLVGDDNPVHWDEEFAAKSFFRRPVAQGMLPAGLISGVLGSQLPGPGAVYLSQTLEFKRAAGLNETITAQVEVVEKDDRQRKLKLRTWAENEAGQVIVDGWAVVLVR